ncbi:type III-B CRISPR module-associated Cmr3 family protein [Halonatronum saccharophilum]|uniref:type III-B CRISPR module-associated Cmr3 family protein n=1 Tax=Halonatronum saccharophilum TaxID=150060 RepID=UPI00047F4590|nr:type III-B CRISPR module-associated Cmr3 family protein [Halonatronum saccharophilum]
MPKYMIRLKPLGEFFFGGEEGFEDKKWGRSEDNQTNIIKSRRFPQQTALLGMLRKEVLIQDDEFELKASFNYKDKECKRMKSLIGKGSFNIENSKQSFGLINSISPLLLTKKIDERHFYMPTPRDHSKKGHGEKKEKMNTSYSPFEREEGETIRTNFGEIKAFKKGSFDAKEGLSDSFIDLTDKKKIIKSEKSGSDEGIFINFERVGIEKKGEKDAFYKQSFYKLNKGFEFVFFADVDTPLKSSIVELGKGRSTFKMEVEEIDISYKDIVGGLNNESDKIILTSDAYIEEDIDKVIDFSIKGSISFRNIKTDKRLIRSKKKYNFWQRGSVIYLKDEKKEDVIEKIRKENLNKIGYNKFV